MGKITLILGGARSGKSGHAVHLAKRYEKVSFIATGETRDKEMARRIARHRKSRPGNWTTFEEGRDLAVPLKKIGPAYKAILIDCMTLWVCNLMLDKRGADEILREATALLARLRRKKADAIIVSNEVGLGIVPVNKLARDFRDVAGRVNQIIAREADEVFFTVSGMPLRIKGGH